jgi:hypothetical protein
MKTIAWFTSVTMPLVFLALPALAQDIRNINIGLVIPMSGPVMVNVTPAVNSIKMAVA